MENTKEQKKYLVTQRLPNNNERVLCFGHKTYCCECDMEEEPAWHEVTFKFCVSSYKLKKQIPEDKEESILDEYTVCENWEIGSDFMDGQVIGVTEWMKMPKQIHNA